MEAQQSVSRPSIRGAGDVLIGYVRSWAFAWHMLLPLEFLWFMFGMMIFSCRWMRFSMFPRWWCFFTLGVMTLDAAALQDTSIGNLYWGRLLYISNSLTYNAVKSIVSFSRRMREFKLTSRLVSWLTSWMDRYANLFLRNVPVFL